MSATVTDLFCGALGGLLGASMAGARLGSALAPRRCSVIRSTVRTARKSQRCGYGSGSHPIQSGERYLEHVISPMHGDIDNPKWDRLRECQECAERYGRGALFEAAR